MEKDISLKSFYVEEMRKLGLSILKSFVALFVSKELQQAPISDCRNIYFSLLWSWYLKKQFMAS